MSDKPSYLGLLNAVALAESGAHCYLSEWAATTRDTDVRRVLLTVAAREGEHAMSFTKRINELGYELRQKPDEGLDKKLEIVRSECSDLEKMEALGLQDLDTEDRPDIFDNFFKDHSIDIRTGELLGRYIAEERDTGRLLRGCYGCLREAADKDEVATNGSGKSDSKALRATNKRLAALEVKVDRLCESIDELAKVVTAEGAVRRVTDFLAGRLAGPIAVETRPKKRPRAETRISATEARRRALSAQGFGRPRPAGPVTVRHLRQATTAVGVVQLDAISVLVRTQFLVLFSRVGAYSRPLFHQMFAPRGELFECAGYRAALMPVAQQPLLRWRAATFSVYRDNPRAVARRKAFYQANAGYIEAIRGEVAERGPLAASQLREPRRRSGEWWERRSDGRRALEFLFGRGDLGAWRTASFERVYDLVERVIPAPILSLPTPGAADAQRALVGLAARSLGVATTADLASYHLLDPATVRARAAELVEAGELIPVEVEGWNQPAYLDPRASGSRPVRPGATLLSPFDSLVWDRRRTSRLFGFDYRIEVYVPSAQRRHGYYVLPLLVGDRLVGRLDLKSDRKNSALQVLAAYAEPDTDLGALAVLTATELEAVGAWLGLDTVILQRRGDLAEALARHRPTWRGRL